MKNNTPKAAIAGSFLPLLLLLLIFSSCRSNKDLTIFRDITTQQTLKGYPDLPPEHHINEFDNLYVSIVSSNKEMNEIYNPAFSETSGRATNSSLIYTQVPGQYIYGYQIDANGDISLPLIGKVNVRGLTLRQSEAAIHAKAKEYLKELSVKVRLLNYKVTVMGEVVKPGVYYNYNYNFTVMDAISEANGITNHADLENVLVIRPTAQGSLTFNLNLSTKEALVSKAYYLQPNDIVIIKPARYKNVQLRAPVYTLVLSTSAAILLLLNFLNSQ
jgi:polysaccharide export outer membrane protein